jgi:hypothetical protein
MPDSSATYCGPNEPPRIARTATYALITAFIANVAMPVPNAAAVTCLKAREIDRTKQVNFNTIDVHMRDGSVYRNTMSTSCSSLRFAGFMHRSFDGEICDQQSFNIQTGGLCSIGVFKKMLAAPETAGRKQTYRYPSLSPRF